MLSRRPDHDLLQVMLDQISVGLFLKLYIKALAQGAGFAPSRLPAMLELLLDDRVLRLDSTSSMQVLDEAP
jgi:hypothetical protein